MKLHGNAALSLNQRRRLARCVVEEPTVRKWAKRYRSEGEAGLIDRPSAANRVYNRTCGSGTEAICALRRLRFTGREIADRLSRAGEAHRRLGARPACVDDATPPRLRRSPARREGANRGRLPAAD